MQSPEPTWQEQFSPEQDLVGSVPTVRYVICSTPRSGSTFVGYMMKNTGVFGYPLEYFNPDSIPRWRQRARAQGYTSIIQFLEGKRTGWNGRLGIKLHWPHLQPAIDDIGLEALQRDWKFILLRRRDVLGQALSWARAAQTGVWMNGLPAQREAVYDRSLIRRYTKLATNHTAFWQRFLAEIGAVPLELVYEDVAANPGTALKSISDFLWTPLPSDLDLSPLITTRVQRTGSVEAWRERFIRETSEQPRSAAPLRIQHSGSLTHRIVSWAKRRLTKALRGSRASTARAGDGLKAPGISGATK